MKSSEFYLCFHDSREIWHSFSRTPLRNFLWCYCRWLITSLALEKCKKRDAIFFNKISWYKVFVHWKLKLLNFPVDSVLICFWCTNKSERFWVNWPVWIYINSHKLSSDKKFKYNLIITSRSVFSPLDSLSPLFCQLFSIFFIDSEIYKTIPIQFPRFFFSPKKGGPRKLTHLCGFWLDVSFSSHVKKRRSRFWLDVSLFSSVKSIFRSSDWLELICVWNLRHSCSVSISQYT